MATVARTSKRSASTGGTTTTRVTPARRQIGSTGSSAIAYFRAIARDSTASAAALREKAPEVARGIRRASKFPGGVDRMAAASKARRQMLRTAAAHEVAARQAGRMVAILNGFKENSTRNSGFDFSR